MSVSIGAVSYLNTKPLIFGLQQQLDCQLRLDLPSRLADDLAARKLDVALIPSVEFLRGRQFSIVSDACIACRGPVRSVRVLFRKPPQRARSLALDEGSRTSRAGRKCYSPVATTSARACSHSRSMLRSIRCKPTQS
ncbi:MAG: MqnA/MqnD/SBP family protein [Pirellulaceae bacterium]